MVFQYDDSDPYDRRKSQYIMAAQLDEIARVRFIRFYGRSPSNSAIESPTALAPETEVHRLEA